MTADDVLQVLALLGDAWVDGGWGVDALVGAQTRDHGDLDVVVTDADDALRRLAAAGFAPFRDLRPTALALRDAMGREVDLHPVTPTPDGGGDQDLSAEPSLGSAVFHYDAPVEGRSGGVAVRCVDAGSQRRAHAGYAPRPVDLHDLALLDALP